MQILIKFLIMISVLFGSWALADVKTSPEDSNPKIENKQNKSPLQDDKKIAQHKLSNEEVKAIKAEAEKLKKQWSIRIPKSLSLATTKRFERAQKYLIAGNFAKSLRLVERVITRPSSSDYERAKALLLKTQILMNTKEYAKAENSITEALQTESLSYSEQCEALMFLAQIQLVTQNYKDAKKNLLKYIGVSPDKAPSAYIMLATIENELGDIKEAERNIDLALAEAKNPQEPWLYFASSVYVKTKNYTKAEKVLKTLLDRRQNNKNYWMTLVGVLFEQGKTTEALQYLEMAQKLGFVTTDSEIMNRGAILSQEKIPYKAALILEQALTKKEIPESQKVYEFIASFWFVAKEYDRSISAYKKASALSNNGSVELLLGQVYLEQEDWLNAQKAFQTALKKGNLKHQKGNAILGLGMTAYFQDDKISALKYFEQAQQFKQQREAADRWISFLK